MDTPERNQIGTPISKIEDSPVFNYINSLSPIKPVKSIHVAHTFNLLSFASLPSVFTSPHVNSRKESGLLTRHHLLDPSKPEFLCDDQYEGSINATISDVVQVSDCYTNPQESFDPGSSIKEVKFDPFNENSKLASELPHDLKYDCGTPDSKTTPYRGIKIDPVLERSGTPALFDQFVQEASVEERETCHPEQTIEERTRCDWENLISDAADLLIFDSSIEASKGQDQKIVGLETSSFTSLVAKLPQQKIDDLQTTEQVIQIGSCEEPEAGDPATQPGEVGGHKEIAQSLDICPSNFHNKQGVAEKSGNCVPCGSKLDSQQQRGVRRRCLVFEMGGSHKKNLEENSNNNSSTSSQSNGKLSPYNKQLVPIKPETSSSPCMLPGIGLHLNALAVTTKDCNVVKHEILASGRQLISMPSPIAIAACHSLTPEQEPLNKSLAQNSVEREMGLDVNEVQVMQDDSQSAEEFNKSALKKKRRRLEQGGENESCKRCNCKKSKCLKLYCECFAAGVYCVEPCSCVECFNKPIHEDTVLATRKQIESRNPLAFAPKVIRSSESVPEIGEDSNRTPASARHKRGCNCKKSGCLKKYCECYQGGVGCSINCRCEGCKNSFGRKDGSTPIGTEEAESEEEEAEACEKNGVDISLQNNEVQNNEEQYSDQTLPITPSFQICRPSVQLLFSSSGKPPRSFVLSVESSPQLHTSQTLEKSEFRHPQPKFEKHFQIIPDDETPEILRVSPIRGVKTASPSRKRVSPPHGQFGLSPSRRSSRKLVLQSIPSFPSLTPHHETSDFPMKFK